MNKFWKGQIYDTVKYWDYTRTEWDRYSLWRYVNYLNEPTKIKDLINK